MSNIVFFALGVICTYGGLTILARRYNRKNQNAPQFDVEVVGIDDMPDELKAMVLNRLTNILTPPAQTLEQQLAQAIADEDFELAAELRDAIKSMGNER